MRARPAIKKIEITVKMGSKNICNPSEPPATIFQISRGANPNKKLTAFTLAVDKANISGGEGIRINI
jgi:hypothetical protein